MTGKGMGSLKNSIPFLPGKTTINRPVIFLSLLFLSLIIFLTFTPYTSADSPDVSIRLYTLPGLDATPGQILTAGFSIDSTIDTAINISTETPVGWACVASPETFVACSGSRTTAFVSIHVPPNTLAGDYPVSLVASSGEDGDILATEYIHVIVAEIEHLEISLLSRPGTEVAAGDTITNSFALDNLGNVTTHASIEIESHPGWSYDILPATELMLEPGKREIITVSVYIPEEITRTISHRLTVTARAPVSETRVSTSVRVIPRSISGSPYMTLDGDVRVITAWQEGGNPSSAVSADSLHADIDHYRSFDISARNILLDGTTDSTFIKNQRIQAAYTDENYGYIRAGDLFLDLDSPLLQHYVSGRGADLLLFSDRYDLRLFHTRTRGSLTYDNTGFQLGHDLGDSFSLRFTGMLNSEGHASQITDTENEESTLVSLLADYSPYDDTYFTAEIAHSDTEQSSSDNAWRLNGRLGYQRFSANCAWLRAGGDFSGAWHDTEHRRINLAWSPADNLYLWINYNLSWNNLDDSTDDTGRHQRNIGYGMSWNIDDIGRLRFSRRRNRNWDNTLDTFDRLTHLTVCSLTRSWHNLTTTAALERQTVDYRITDDIEETNSVRIDVNTRLYRDAYLRLSYTHGQLSGSGYAGFSRTSNINCGTQFRLARNLTGSLNFRRNTGGILGRRTDIFGLLSWGIDLDSDLNLRIRDYSNSFGGDTEIAIEYSHAISIPIALLPDVGTVEGSLFMADEPESGLSGVKISVDETEVITGDSGGFAFPALDPGPHTLTVDPSSLGVGMITDTEIPLVFTVEPGRTTRVDIPVIQSVSIRGRVYIKSDSEDTTDRPLADLLVEIKGENISDFRITNAGGNYLFSGLRPGIYELTLRTSNLPPGYQSESPSTCIFELVAGDGRTIIDFLVTTVDLDIVITTGSKDSIWEF